MNEQNTPNERGLALEQRLERLFRANGYEVLHDVWRPGRSGVQHQIDVLAQYICPLHTSTVIIEAKAYTSAVDKDRVMKLKDIVQDLGADRGILVTTHYYTADALKTAVGTNIDLWDRDRLSKMLGEVELTSVASGGTPSVRVTERVVSPKIDLEQTRAELTRLAEKKARGTLGIGKVRETLIEVRPISYPYYEASLSVEIEETRRSGFKRETIRKLTSTTVSFDAPSGALVEPTPTGIDYSHEWMSALTGDELAIMRLARAGRFSVQSLAAIGLTDSRIKRAVAMLVEKKILERQDTRPVEYRPLQAFPEHPHGLASISSFHEQLSDADVPYERATKLLVEPAAIVRAIESYWPGTATSAVTVVYYPYYCAQYRLADGSTRFDVFDAVTGKANEAVKRHIKLH